MRTVGDARLQGLLKVRQETGLSLDLLESLTRDMMPRAFAAFVDRLSASPQYTQSSDKPYSFLNLRAPDSPMGEWQASQLLYVVKEMSARAAKSF